jgi:predicted ATPase/serine phosphatase RsbU (regulator of sigma subunit)/tRNA A-37 threonylcarbamoyl transferase component Bud32
MEKIQDYVIIEKIAETRGSLVYRGRKEDEQDTVVIKVLKTRYPSLSEIARYKQEYELIKSIDLDGVIKTYDLLEHNGKFALILEDFDGVSLKEMLEKKKSFDVKLFLKTAVKIAEILGNLHMKDVVHRDIKPHNILINQKTETLKITDFGISAVLTHENDEVYNPDFILGTLSYMSPEQTGRINRTVDYRTDLYSLGITLYEMLTGTLPFKSYDPMEIIHSHIAVLPLPPAMQNPGIPKIISDIIMKLLSKTPEERYQNGFGLMADLKECIAQMDKRGKIVPFGLAVNDISNKFIIPQKLCGREKEIDILLSSFENVTNREKGAAVIVVSGAPGIGKSALVHEILKPIVTKRGYFISGKYEQFRRDKPYSAIIQAFQVLVRQILSESEEMIRIWKEDLLTVLGANGRVITEVIPDIEMIIGKQPELPALGPEETKNRFNFVFEKFTNVFPAKGHPIALFLDDLQWADRASLQLMRNIITNSEIRNFLLILSFRDNEVDDAHQIMDFLKEVGRHNVKINRILLGPLVEKDIKDLVMNFLKCTDKRGMELANLLHKKTGGNPFFVNQFLLTLYNEKMIVPDEALGWRWDVHKISSMHVTDNLVELMAGKIGKLTVKTQDVLKICACIGNRFDLETIASVRGTSIYDALQDLTEAVHHGLVSPLADVYIFHHDRIQEAAYSLVTDSEKSGLHYRIGKLARDAADENELQNKLFYIVDQLNLGVAMITDGVEREKLARLNLEAGKKAKASAAYAPAFRYLKDGIELLETNSWHGGQYELTLALYAESTEAAYLMGDYDTMSDLAGIVLNKAKTILDKVGVYVSQINASIAREDFHAAIEIALPVIKQLSGIRIPKKATKMHIGFMLMRVMIMLLGKKPEDILNTPRMTDPHILATGKLLASVGIAAFFVDPNMLAYGLLLALKLSGKYGHAPEHAFAYTAYGIVLSAGLWNFEGAIKYGNLGMMLMDKLGAKDQECRCSYIYNGIISHWVDPVKETIAPLMDGYRIGLETGDLNYAGFSLFFSDVHSLYAGIDLSELDRMMEKNNQILIGFNQKYLQTLHSLSWQSIINIMGKGDDPLKVTGKVIDGEAMVPVWMSTGNHAALSVFWYVKLTLCFLFNEYSMTLEASRKFNKYKEAQQGVIINRYAVFNDSVARLFLYQEATRIKKIQYRIHLAVSKVKLKRWAESSPANTMQLLLAAEALYAWHVRGDMDKAERLFSSALQMTKKYRDVIHEGLINEFAMKFYLARNDEETARERMAAAFTGYFKWGAIGVLNNLIKMYPHLAPANTPVKDINDTLADSTGTRAVSLDLSSVLKASQTLSGEIVLERLLVSMVKIVMENAGAQKGFMILEERGRFYVEAEGKIGSEDIPVLKSIPVESHGGLSSSIVNYVARTKRTLILNNADSEGEFINDPYVLKYRPKSILCSAILNQGKLSAIIYLENNLAAGAFTPDRLEVLNILSSQVAISIDNAKLYENLEEKVKERTEELRTANEQLTITKNALWGELELAKKIQTVLLPKEPALPGYAISAYMMPAFEVGGDYYDFINAKGKDWIVIGDVSGHGVTAGLVMMMTQTAIHNTILQQPDATPSELLKIVNSTIAANIRRIDEDKFVTITVLAAHENGRFTFSGLHQSIMIYRAHTGNIELIETNGMWIGIFEEINGKVYDETLTLNIGDVMMLFTDGITEAWKKDVTGKKRRADENMFGEDKLQEILRTNGRNSPVEIQNAILQEMQNYETNDDITIVLLKRID